MPVCLGFKAVWVPRLLGVSGDVAEQGLVHVQRRAATAERTTPEQEPSDSGQLPPACLAVITKLCHRAVLQGCDRHPAKAPDAAAGGRLTANQRATPLALTLATCLPAWPRTCQRGAAGHGSSPPPATAAATRPGCARSDSEPDTTTHRRTAQSQIPHQVVTSMALGSPVLTLSMTLAHHGRW